MEIADMKAMMENQTEIQIPMVMAELVVVKAVETDREKGQVKVLELGQWGQGKVLLWGQLGQVKVLELGQLGQV